MYSLIKKKTYGFVKMLFKRKVCNDYFIWKTLANL